MIVILSGVSGVGKTTIAKLLEDDGFIRSVSYTSRAKRVGEEHGKDYMFIESEEFEQKISQGFFLEHTNQFGNYYGTGCEQIDKLVHANDTMSCKIIMCLSKEGFQAALSKWPKLVLGIYLLPPAASELEERLCLRGSSDTCIRMQAIYERTQIDNLAKDYEGYHYTISPSSIESTLADVLNAIECGFSKL